MDLKELYRQAKNEDLMSSHSIEKHSFQTLLLGMINKLTSKKDLKSQEQLNVLNRMNKFLERLTYFNVIFTFQSKIICNLETDLAILEQEKEDLLKENNRLKSVL